MLRAETRERLRLLIREIETRPRAVAPAAPAPAVREPEVVPARPWEGGDDLEPAPRGLREAVRRETAAGTFTYRELRYDLDYAVGAQPLSELDALASAIEVLLQDDALRARLARNARATVEARFDSAANARRLAELLRGGEASVAVEPQPAPALRRAEER